ncbi:hypothetical protein [Sphingobium sp. 15-1]|uniref:hypothetical protein n=1 Tax=Sphingobium sp. 15-1 TaxID=2729616 RepID=UPI001C3FDD6C|nr:hypothetical protein [Sphingobium sp. 15-1]
MARAAVWECRDIALTFADVPVFGGAGEGILLFCFIFVKQYSGAILLTLSHFLHVEAFWQQFGHLHPHGNLLAVPSQTPARRIPERPSQKNCGEALDRRVSPSI